VSRPYYPVRALTTGVVMMFHVESGAAVAEGDTLAEIEMMKVFQRVEACATGTVEWVVALGETVHQDTLLGKIYPA
jgi:Pyruvate/2-oxoglutarate dehydrogenase complex, dihydrolipoamide acyltransferase (E2) component, and related enzymes